MIQRIRVSGLLVRNGTLLLVSHKKKDDEYWLLPGGGVDPGETLVEALKREFLEETGIHVTPGKVLFLSDTVYPDGSKQVHHIFFEVTAEACELIKGEDIERAEFISVAECASLKFYPPVMEKITLFLGGKEKISGAEYLGKLWE